MAKKPVIFHFGNPAACGRKGRGFALADAWAKVPAENRCKRCDAAATEASARQMMPRTRAAVAVLNGADMSESAKMAAFLDIFHPTLDNARRVSLMQDARGRRTR